MLGSDYESGRAGRNCVAGEAVPGLRRAGAAGGDSRGNVRELLVREGNRELASRADENDDRALARDAATTHAGGEAEVKGVERVADCLSVLI